MPDVTRPCRACGRELAGAKKGVRYCNPDCQKAYWAAIPRACSICKEIKPGSAFAACRTRPAGRSECRACRAAITHARYEEGKKTQVDRARWAGVKWRYGITKDDWLAMFDAQGGCCRICGRTLTVYTGGRQDKSKTVTDHCHETGTVRGILCGNCNLGIGYLHTPELLTSALTYLTASPRSFPDKLPGTRKKPKL